MAKVEKVIAINFCRYPTNGDGVREETIIVSEQQALIILDQLKKELNK